MNATVRKYLIVALFVVASFCLVVGFWRWFGPSMEPKLEQTLEPIPTPVSTSAPTTAPIPTGTPDPALEESESPAAASELPVGKLVSTKTRDAYVGGTLSIFIPILNMTRTVLDGTDEATLSKGVGLYEYAQLPGVGHRNVSLAGHRNGVDKNGRITDRAPFYYVDILKEGDYLYLYNNEYIYRYIWSYTEIITPDDWSPIYTTEESSLTITTCHPIGISDHRMVVRAVLDDTFEYSDSFDYVATKEED